MKKVKVIRALEESPTGLRYCYIQQVTDKQVVVIDNEHSLRKYNRADGRIKHSYHPRRIRMNKVEQFLDQHNLDKWHGGWKPAICTERLTSHDNMEPDYTTWFEKQGVSIINCL